MRLLKNLKNADWTILAPVLYIVVVLSVGIISVAFGDYGISSVVARLMILSAVSTVIKCLS